MADLNILTERQRKLWLTPEKHAPRFPSVGAALSMGDQILHDGPGEIKRPRVQAPEQPPFHLVPPHTGHGTREYSSTAARRCASSKL